MFPHFQGLKTSVIDNTDTLFLVRDQGLSFPVRTNATVISSYRDTPGSAPMIDMRHTVGNSGTPVVYRSQMARFAGKHMEGFNGNDVSVFEIKSNGQYECKTPNAGMILQSANGSRFELRITDTGEINIVSL